MADQAALLALTNVSKLYEAPDPAAAVTVLHDITLTVERGESVAIVGPSGSGKSTLLNIIGTLDQPSSGRVWLAGQELSRLRENQLAAIRNRQIGFVFQSHHLLPHCSALENVLVPTLAAGKGGRSIGPGQPESFEESESAPERRPAPSDSPEDRARKLLLRVGLGDRMHHRPGQLSGGERQRVAVVRALINAPPLLLADEPTGALDHAAATELGELLVDLNQEEGVTLIVVTHSLPLAQRMRRVLELREGTLREAA
jgi:ABC-type lipoprotein export system ATPase subunit